MTAVLTEWSAGNVFEAIDLRKSFQETQALRGVSICVRPGEILGIVGENGAGKSTLLKIISGIQPADAGQMLLRGAPVAFRSVREASRWGISLVSQEGSLLPNLSVEENLFLGREEMFQKYGRISWKDRRAKATALLREVGSEIDPREQAWRIPVGQRAMVEVARILGTQNEGITWPLFIFDEPTSALSTGETERLFKLMRDMTKYASLIFVSHRLSEIIEMTDRVYVFRDGKVAGEVPSGSMSASELQRLMVGRELEADYYLVDRQVPPSEDEVIRLEGLTMARNYSGVSFHVTKGEVLGLCGVEGAGCEMVLRSVAGLTRPSEGRIRLDGEEFESLNPSLATRRGIGYVSADRLREGLVLPLDLSKNVTLPRLDLVSTHGLLSSRKQHAVADNWIERFRVRCAGSHARAGTLSGGNQQKIVLARWLAAKVRLLLLDHPTRGIDVGAKADVYRLIRELTLQGMAIILVGDTMEEVIGLSHRLVCMRDGNVTQILNASGEDKPDAKTVLSYLV